MNRRHIRLFVLALAAFAIVAPSSALAVAISPGAIVVKQMLRGTGVSRSLTIFNTSSKPDTYTFHSTTKPVSQWITVLDPQTHQEVASLLVPAKSSRSVQVAVAVPKSTANGKYAGSLEAEPESSGQTGTVLVPSLLINISVVDKEIIDMQLQSLTVSDIEAGMPVAVHVFARNLSNIDIAPTLLFGVVDGDTVLRKAEFDLAQIGVKNAGSEEFDLDLADLKVGKYRAYGQLKYGRVLTPIQWVEFAVVPKGTFTNASLQGFRVSGGRTVGDTVTLTGTFLSKSPRALKPKLVADVYLDDLKIGSVEGTEASTDPYQRVDIAAPLKIQKAGAYRIEAYFAYSGKNSNKKAFSFEASEPKTDRSPYVYGAIALVAFAAIGLGYYLNRRSNRKTRVKGEPRGSETGGGG